MPTGKIIIAFSIITLYSLSNCSGDIAETIRNRFYDQRTFCYDRKGNRHAAYKCSGLLIRGVRHANVHNSLEYAWSFKPRNLQKTSFAVAFLRNDTPFSAFPSGYISGFIIYPHWKTPKKKNTYKVYCAFPLDGHTDGRGGRHACGRSQDDPVGTSIHCDQLGITTFGKWMTHYYQIRAGKYYFVRRQCALDMTLPTAARDFGIFLKANQFIRNNKDSKQSKYAYRDSELVVHTWNASNPHKIPIEAFFYLIGFPNAYAQAKMYQNDYNWLTGELIPIVGIRLPTAARRNLEIVHRRQRR